MNSNYLVLGGMAGSSMDGLDLCLAEFHVTASAWHFQIKKSQTVGYTSDIKKRLEAATTASRKEQAVTDVLFGKWIGEQVSHFLGDITPCLVAVHGHTVIHAPHRGVSYQLGHGPTIADECGLAAVTAFRSLDVSLGGQGAPLVPVGDFELFTEYDACINLGGIANVSVKKQQKAWDVCPCNQVLNFFAGKLGQEYDAEGALAQQGETDSGFLKSLLSLSYFHQTPPKSLPNGYISSDVLEKINPYDGLKTYGDFIAGALAKDLQPILSKGKVLITGGGAHNHYLTSRIKETLAPLEVVVPSSEIIDFKEALVFAFLGLKKHLGEINTLASVTGASRDSCGGEVHWPG